MAAFACCLASFGRRHLRGSHLPYHLRLSAVLSAHAGRQSRQRSECERNGEDSVVKTRSRWHCHIRSSACLVVARVTQPTVTARVSCRRTKTVSEICWLYVDRGSPKLTLYVLAPSRLTTRRISRRVIDSQRQRSNRPTFAIYRAYRRSNE